MLARFGRTIGVRAMRDGSRGPYIHAVTLVSPWVTFAEPSGRTDADAVVGTSDVVADACGDTVSSIDRNSYGRRPSMR